jgi:hypothetical protein
MLLPRLYASPVVTVGWTLRHTRVAYYRQKEVPSEVQGRGDGLHEDASGSL